MKFVHFNWNGERHLGVLNAENKVICFKHLGIKTNDMNAFIIHYDEFKNKLIDLNAHPAIEVPKEKLLAPITEPLQDIICLGINFLDHAKESAKFKGENFEERKYPVYFGKRVNYATAPYAKIPLHSGVTNQLDYECELAFILAKDAYKIKADEAKNYIFGYTIINEISARDLQAKHKQFYRAKSLEGSTIMGPCIVSIDELSYPPKLQLKSYVNGELRQDDNTKNFIFDIAYVLEELSAGMRLKAGTIISMGTPSGVGMGLNPPQFLKDQDEVRCEIEKIGTLCNIIDKNL
ncbi:fumarylacetoacetate hydrolase family protein [Campylobacter upsaliensis]|uniref:fumarylacetoacetate hydrolase family protein n=1 Tax=Campylobacter upsaliensis TaxID=28080 RepID=UPI0017D51EA8|nr:fumarylacetoacetate hydrolase family protein [Campylobacter upsaliensis]EAH9987171.1 FAA hydrolase family protein [Campylobacter upsaliensis]EKS7444496.1 fumarylacetoacetate hydrolase family protein [Campylobacter upsaliensis]MEB2807624.1 fumarylacetoacetate hydrolase family protein [Campylobacter upsaliensis]HED8510611.1 fumarylacetoacetate hydrolase family protein [Campylobacter upsaliensis]